MSGQRLSVNHDADGAFARLASETWLRATDDFAVPDDEEVEAYWRLGFLHGMQIIATGSADADAERRALVADALREAIDMLDAGTEQ
jgi:hypothetical protein